MTEVLSTNPVTGAASPLGVDETTSDDVARCAAIAAVAAPHLASATLVWRAAFLDAVAHSLESISEEIVDTARHESGLGEARLAGELRRTCFQFRFFADVVRDGAFLEASVDHACDSPMGPLPDLRRQLEPLGPVGVFGASNFPLAFSVPGGDTASALAAGCPVIVKAHPAHPRTSLVTYDAIERACRSMDAPIGTVQLVFGLDAGTTLVTDPHITAVGFTGSYGAGRTLFDLAQGRPVPIPFYGELGSVNPLVVTPRAAAARGGALGEGLVGSVTLGSGQFCTKPQLLFVPNGRDGDVLVDAATTALHESIGASMLTSSIRDRFLEGVHSLLDVPGVHELARSPRADTASGAFGVLLSTDVGTLLGHGRDVIETECFGALAVIVRYDDDRQLLEALESLEPALTFTCHVDDSDPLGPALLDIGRRKAGRVIVNGFPTGVGVSWSMHHGGPLPAATSSLHSSVGASAIRRWLRPVSYQSVPDAWLPPALQESNPLGLPRRVDGVRR